MAPRPGRHSDQLALWCGVEVERRHHGDDSRRIDRAVRLVVMSADLLERDGVLDARPLVEIAQVRPEVAVLGNLAHRAFEVDLVDGVESDQSREQAPIGLERFGAEQEPARAEAGVEFIESREQLVDRAARRRAAGC